MKQARLRIPAAPAPGWHWAGDIGGGGVRPEMVFSPISEGLPSPPLRSLPSLSHAELASSSFFSKRVLLLVNGEKLAGVGQGRFPWCNSAS